MAPLILAELPAVPESIGRVRRAAKSLARRCGANKEVVSDIGLAVSEAATNAVVHAYREGRHGRLALAAEAIDGEMRFSVMDDGEGLTPRSDSPGLGLGLPLIARLSDSFEVRPGPRGRGTHLFMTFRLV